MPQVFLPRANAISRALILGLPLASLAAGTALGYATVWSDWYTLRNTTINQTVPFSHEHHVSGLGIDCRYCHTSVEQSRFAGIPPTRTCMSCHWQIWTNAELLAPVRESFATGKPLVWNRVYDLPDYVYFDHSIHVAKGVGCSTCHGAVQNMPLTRRVPTLQMRWCLDCHRSPEKYLRPRSEVFNMDYQPPADQLALGRKLAAEYHLRKDQMTNCSVCHR